VPMQRLSPAEDPGRVLVFPRIGGD